MAQHISLKFQNNTESEGIRLFSVGLKASILPSRNTTSVDLKGDHISLKFQNNTVSEAFVLNDVGLGIVALEEQ